MSVSRTPDRTRQRSHTARPGSIPILFEQPGNCGTEQQDVIAVIARALHAELSAKVNYDHVRLALPKADLPLSYRHHRYDVACLISDRVILVDVVSVNVRYWQQGEVTEHGEGQE